MSDLMKAQEETDLYNKELPRFKKIQKDEKQPPAKEVRKGRTADPDDKMNSNAPLVFGLEMEQGPSQIRIAKPYDHTPTGPDPEWMSPRKRQVRRERGVKEV